MTWHDIDKSSTWIFRKMVNFFVFGVTKNNNTTGDDTRLRTKPFLGNLGWRAIQLRVSHATELGSSSRRAGGAQDRGYSRTHKKIGRTGGFGVVSLGDYGVRPHSECFRCQFFVDSKTNCWPLWRSFLIIFDIQLFHFEFLTWWTLHLVIVLVLVMFMLECIPYSCEFILSLSWLVHQFIVQSV